MTIAWMRMTHAIPTMCLVGSLCCLAKSISRDSDRVKRANPLPSDLIRNELFAADDADLGQAEPLRGGHDAGRDPVLRRLVRAEVDFRLRIDRCGHADLVLERHP